MVVAQITDLDVDVSEILMASWEISDAKDFKNIIASSMEDKVNLTSIVFETLDIDYGVEYYGRVSIFLADKGWSKFNNVAVILKERDDHVTVKNTYPTLINPPRLKLTYKDKEVDTSKTPLTNLTLEIEDNTIVGLGEIIGHDIYILNDKNEVIYKNIRTTLKSIDLKDIILNENRVYRILCSAVCSTNEVSLPSNITFITQNSAERTIKIFFKNVFSKEQNVAAIISYTLPFDNNINSYDVEIFKINNNATSSIFKQRVTTDAPVFNIPANTLSKNTPYLFTIEDNNGDITNLVVYVK